MCASQRRDAYGRQYIWGTHFSCHSSPESVCVVHFHRMISYLTRGIMGLRYLRRSARDCGRSSSYSCSGDLAEQGKWTLSWVRHTGLGRATPYVSFWYACSNGKHPDHQDVPAITVEGQGQYTFHLPGEVRHPLAMMFALRLRLHWNQSPRGCVEESLWSFPTIAFS